ncbi:GPI transamidase component PIG-S-like [Paramacrobiotus metropolitanus]|uniref:GPI transamidase component PIG-S-like n=1 Tax=Paramacrobiotus metropolitanus TaxID=2943436 RepID=UPI002445D846|nr:GPI transamidase component PIG-S-like [Paramacrobiotus metropolitanus]
MTEESSAEPTTSASEPQESTVKEQLEERPFSDIAICCFYVAVFCLVGVPIWWKTTTVTRVSVPYDEIDVLRTYGELRMRDAPTKEVSGVQPALQQRWDTFWNVPACTTVDIVFTLVNPTPEALTVSWNIQEGLKKYLDPALSLLHPLANFSVSSQILRFMDEPLITTPGGANGGHSVSLQEASKIINHVESRLGSFSSDHRIINMIIYIPTAKQRPLRLLDASGTVVATNSIITPRWGGVMIYSPETLTPELSVMEVNVQSVAEIFLTQLFVHWGLFKADAQEGAIDFAKDLPGLFDKRARVNVDDSISTLKSLARLLDQMGSIAINDIVGRNIYDAVRHIHDAQQALSSGDERAGLLSSRRAWENSERAFYDPSLLEQLYFPDDQKFAIYVPLFLPAALPVILSVTQISKWVRRRRSGLNNDIAA